MNIMFRIKDVLVTPMLGDSILAGITRKNVLNLAKENNIEVEERRISVEEILEALQNESLKEAFGVGTAVTINSINSITFRDKKFTIAPLSNSYAQLLKETFREFNMEN